VTPRGEELAGALQQRLSPESLRVIGIADEIAGELRQSLYLAGGAVRDLLLGRTNLDVDLVTEGDVTALASILAERLRGRMLLHGRFGTAKVRWDGSSADLAMARAETYDRPGALPKVRPGSIEEDLGRRDFTINSMAVRLDGANYGKKVDPYRGAEDLKRGLIRILHERSFVDDPTRMFRAVRYEQRFGFQLEPGTERLLRSNISGLHEVSGDRIRHEMELILREEGPERALLRAQDVGLLKEVHPKLRADEWLRHKYQQARAMYRSPPTALYFGLLSYGLTPGEAEELIGQLKLPRTTATVVRDAVRLKNEVSALEVRELAPSSVCRILSGYSPTAIMTCAIATDSGRAAERLRTYVATWRQVKPLLDGRALQEMGITPGPKVGDMLRRLREAKLDGLVKTREDEVRMVERWLSVP
jgi:tRNA nucleotidyltransferase (CCA-adding enzyme)